MKAIIFYRHYDIQTKNGNNKCPICSHKTHKSNPNKHSNPIIRLVRCVNFKDLSGSRLCSRTFSHRWWWLQCLPTSNVLSSINCRTFKAYVCLRHFGLVLPNSAYADVACSPYGWRQNSFFGLKRRLPLFIIPSNNVNCWSLHKQKWKC